MTEIPGIIHQSWKDEHIPYSVYDKSWIQSWVRAHPNWEIRFWTDDANEQLVRENYPQFYDFYLSLAPAIKKADFCRFLYMHRYGGVYVDLDFVCLKNLSPLLRGYDIVLGRLSEDNDYYQIPNAFMASRPEHKFWMQVAWDAMRAPPAEQAIESHAGPLRLQWAYQVYQPKRSIVYGDELIYPFDWIHFTSWSNGKYYRADRKRLAMELRGKKPEEIAEVFPHSYCLTFWTHNW